MTVPGPLRARLEATVQRHWWAAPPVRGLWRLWAPFSAFYGAATALRRRLYSAGLLQAQEMPVPVLVVGNLVAGGAGKTPTVIALAQALQRRGWRPGVVSRGHGGKGGLEPREVDAASTAADVGDEPLLIHRRTGVPVVVGRSRPAAGRALLAAHPEVNVLLADDGLQHLALARHAEVIVFDERGLGNSALLPMGPLREPLPANLPPRARVLYNAPAPTTPLAGPLVQRRFAGASELAAWWRGEPPSPMPPAALLGQPCLAVAGTARPQRFFDMLAAAGLHIQGLGLPDHAGFDPLPWPAGTGHVLVTEKDAVKLRPGHTGGATVWVVSLDFALPDDWVDELSHLLLNPPHGPSPA